jgi:prophage regulatory protein
MLKTHTNPQYQSQSDQHCNLPNTMRLTCDGKFTSLVSDAPSTFQPDQQTLIPATGFMRQKQVLALVPISKSTLWRRIQEGSFPKPVKLSPRVTVWRTQDIRVWIENYAVGST